MHTKKAFSLVELVVTITILVILGTISFIVIQGYSANARDAKRISDVENLYSKVNYEVALGADITKLMTGSKQTEIIINGQKQVSNIGTINFSNIKEQQSSFQDPTTSEDYLFAYSMGIVTKDNGKKEGYEFMEFATMSEIDDTSVIIGDYYKYKITDSPSLFNIGSGMYLINGKDKDGVVYVPQGPITPSSCTAKKEILTATSKFTNKIGIAHNSGVQCDTNDIIVCTGNGTGITLAACNVGARYATAEACTNSDYAASLNGGDNGNCTTDKLGLYFQWGSSIGYLLENEYSLSSSYDYPVDSGLTQGTESTSDKWNQGPCPSGYHIPSPQEWVDIMEAGNVGGHWKLGNFTPDSTKYNGGYWNLTFWNDVKVALMLPATGVRGPSMSNPNEYPSTKTLQSQGSYIYYWSNVVYNSSASKAWLLSIIHSRVSVLPATRVRGYTIRCFKN